MSEVIKQTSETSEDNAILELLSIQNILSILDEARERAKDRYHNEDIGTAEMYKALSGIVEKHVGYLMRKNELLRILNHETRDLQKKSSAIIHRIGKFSLIVY